MSKPDRRPARPEQMETLAVQLLPHYEMFLAFTRKRVADPELAADALQDSLHKALKSIGHVRQNESLVPWFYRILRRTIIDLYRRRSVRERLFVELPENFEAVTDQAERSTVCGCLRRLLPTLKPEYAQAIEAVDLDEAAIESVAAELGVSRSSLKVRLHRARRQLHERLLQTCQLCARHACLDCHCSESDATLKRMNIQTETD